MPRRRNARPVAESDLPAELLDVDDPVWRSPRSAAAWLRSHGLELGKHPAWWGAPSLHHRAVVVWAVANGYGMERWPKLPDWRRLREAGMPPEFNARARLAWLTQARVE